MVVALACDGLAATSGFAEDVVVVRPARAATPSSIRAELRREHDHPHYGVELEPHFVLQWGDLPYRTSAGLGIGFRASIPLLDPGPIPSFNNSLALSFGLDWAHFGSCRYDAPDCYGRPLYDHAASRVAVAVLGRLILLVSSLHDSLPSARSLLVVSAQLLGVAAAKSGVMSNPARHLVNRCLETMYAHLDAPRSIAALAQQLGVSESVLKRAFSEVLETSPAALYRRLRLELAFRTLHNREQSVLETALAAGFDDHAAFSRSFRRAFGFAPSHARKVVNLQRELESIALEEPDIVELASLTLQVASATGSYFTCAPRAWAALGQALLSLPPERTEHALFVGQALDDPHAPAGPQPEAVRFLAGVVGVEADLGLAREATLAGRYARFRYTGLLANIGLAYHHIYGAWRDQAAAAGFTLSSAPALIMSEELPSGAPQRVLIAVPIEPQGQST